MSRNDVFVLAGVGLVVLVSLAWARSRFVLLAVGSGVERQRSRIARALVGVLVLGVSVVASSLGGAEVASAAGDYESMVPVRLHDSRKVAIRPAGSILKVTVAGVKGVPKDATAVMLNLTAVAPVGAGYLTVFPCGAPLPHTSSLNYSAGDVRAGATLVKVGANRQVCIFTLATTHVVVDLNGFVPVGGTPEPIVPVRRYDSRKSAKRPAGSITKVKVVGVNGVPPTAQAVFLNVAAVLPTAAGHLTVYPCGAAKPGTANVNYTAGSVSGNAVFTGVGFNNEVCIYTAATSHIVVDLTGFVAVGGNPEPLVPFRAADSRKSTIRQAGSTWPVKVAGVDAVPVNATTVAMNVAAVAPTGSGHLTVFPCGSPRPSTSNVNYDAGSTTPNMVFSKVGAGSSVCIYTTTTTHVVVDVSGFVAYNAVTGCYVDGTFVVTTLTQNECNGLSALHFDTKGWNWTKKNKWMTATDPCTWYGVVCDNGHVTELWLGSNNLVGSIPQEIENLSWLTILAVDANSITALNPAITKLDQLWMLNVRDNQISALPPKVGDLSSLTVLDAAHNNLSAVPWSIGKLSKLNVLEVGYNNLTGLPSSVGNLGQIIYLGFAYNVMGKIPPAVKNLSTLENLSASNNFISVVPLWMKDMSSLIFVDLSHNWIAGNVTNQLMPISGNLQNLWLNGNNCITASATFTLWLNANSPNWDDGC